MDWSKAKSILIALLLAVNAFLLVTYIMRENEVRNDEMTVRSDVCRILEAQGVSVEESVIPLDSVEILPAILETSADIKSTAEKIFGSVTESVTGENIAYSGDGGNIMLLNDSFSLVYESGNNIASASDAENLARSIASQMSVSTAPRDFECEASDGGYIVKVPQIFSGVPVFDCDIELRISGSGSVIAHGKFIGKGKISTTSGEVTNTSALILSFADEVKTAGYEKLDISEITLGYISKTQTQGRISLVPTLEFKTDNGVFYVDMQTGEMVEF